MEKEPVAVGSYHVHRQIGEGGQAKVYLVSRNGHIYAAKVYEPGHSKIQLFKTQVRFLQKIKSPFMINIIEALSCAQVKWTNDQVDTRNVIILEYAQHGQLYQLIDKEGALSAPTCKKIFWQLLSTIETLYESGICHRDLKPDNILFDKDFNIKLADFGLSCSIEGEDGDRILTDKVGTDGFRSPEMERSNYDGHQSDIFAAGVILFTMFSGSPPFLSTKFTDKIYKMIREKNYQRFWSIHQKKKTEGYYPQEFKKLLNSFFSQNPENRPTLQDLKENAWLKPEHSAQDAIFQQISQKIQKIENEDPQKVQLQTIINKAQGDLPQMQHKESKETCVQG